jgi:cyclopropane fatty-acyl-phospholipid synthase-like methyltransferase
MLEQEAKQERDLQHQLWLMTLNNKLSLAPLKKEPQQVLDLATGTGMWAMEYALEHPTAAVIGSDLSPIQPELYVHFDFRANIARIPADRNYHQASQPIALLR